ncbi:unnamed protein product, partial [Enterobius vermicularis]|uniref:C3H1-type domain-containing protein n=1 Tax=Enterobius vermicularis TaxID=51028 RepID=A0A0N4V1J0_ENTVE
QDRPSQQNTERQRRKASAYKTVLCQAFKDTGKCEFGDNCCFAHGEKELRLPPQAHPKYKTQLCNKFSISGYCPYGSRCQFIHQKPSDALIASDFVSTAVSLGSFETVTVFPQFEDCASGNSFY